MTGSPRWVFTDGLAHVLADGGDDGNGAPAFRTLCGCGVAATVPVYRVPPSLDVCRSCVPLPGETGSSPPPGPLDVPPPTFPSTPTVF